MTRIVLFDWTAGGHRPIYVQRIVEALRPFADLVVVMPSSTLARVERLDVEMAPLEGERPPLGGRLQRRAVLAEEARLFRAAAARGDHAFHLYADHVLPRLVREPPLPCPTSLLTYYPRSHYRTAFGTRLSLDQVAIAQAKDVAVRVWRRRNDAASIATLDEVAARRWAAARGAAAWWLPEPPVAALSPGASNGSRSGCIVYGALAPRKGIDLLCRALTSERTSVAIVLAGTVEDSYRTELERLAAAMTAQGVDVDLRAHHHTEAEGLALLAQACCAVLPYPSHSGMSRVLLEACAVGTPVVAHEFGLVGHLVRTYGLGVAVDCRNPHALREAVLRFSDPDLPGRYGAALERFADRYAPSRFRTALRLGLGLG